MDYLREIPIQSLAIVFTGKYVSLLEFTFSAKDYTKNCPLIP